MKKETSAEQATDKTITMEHAKASADALLLPDELLSCRKAPNPLYAFPAETLESFSQNADTFAVFQTDDKVTEQAMPESDHSETCCKDPAENYEIGRQIAAGGQGAIHQAYDRQFQRIVAVKSLRKETTGSYVRKDFFREAQVTAQLQHPGIVPIHNLWVDHGDCPHLAMKMVEGVTLRNRLESLRKQYDAMPWRKIASRERLQLKERLEIFLKVCDALAYAHNRNMIHRDLKPENIMLGRFGAVYVLDWGISESVAENRKIRSSVCGTPRYMAPEVLNRQPYGKTADIYQMGLILYELVYLRHAYPLADPAAAMTAAMSGHTAPQNHLYGCRTAPLLQHIISKALAFRPENRYQDIRDLAKDVHAFLNQAPVSVDKHPYWSAFTRVLMRHSQKLLAVIAVLILTVLGLLSWNLAEDLRNERLVEMKESALRNVYATYLRNVLQVDRRFMEVDGMLQQLCREAETRLEKLPLPDPAMKFYDHTAGRSGKTAPPQFKFSTAQGMKASFEVPLYKLPETPVPEWKSYLTALVPMVRSCRNIMLWNALSSVTGADLAKIRTPVIAVYIGLQNGLFLTYPYTGDFPEDYDPREQPWYRKAVQKDSSGICWTDPYFDRSVGKTVISAAVPVRDRRGNVIGVLGMDLEPETMIRAFVRQDDIKLEHIEGQYLLNEDGMIIATLDDTLKPGAHDVQLKPFPYMNFFPDIRHLKTGRLFVGGFGRRLAIFHYIKSLECYFVQIIDFGRVFEDAGQYSAALPRP